MNENLVKIIKHHLIEMSFTDVDIPRYFYIVLHMSDKTLKELEDMKITGVRGISGNGRITVRFLPKMDAYLIMDAKKVVDANRLSRVLYDNPEYLMSNDFKAFLRLIEFNSVIRAVGVILLYLLPEYGLANGSSTIDSVRSNMLASNKKLDSPIRFANAFKSAIGRNDLDASQVATRVAEVVMGRAKVFRGEREWILKSNSLVIPQGSKLVLRDDKVYPRNVIKSLLRKYRVKLLDYSMFQQRIKGIEL